MITVREVRQRLCNMWEEGITGVVTTYYQIPRVLQDAALPGVVVFPAAAEYDRETFGEQLEMETRIYEMVLYVEKAAYGTEGQTELNTDTYFDQVKPYFDARPGLELDSQGANQSFSVYQSHILGDGGFQVGPYPLAGQGSPDYVQIRWRLQVMNLSPVVYTIG